MKVKLPKFAIRCYSNNGPIFGQGDFNIAGDANSNVNSYSLLGYSYQHPTYALGTDESYSFLAGSYFFQVSEIEVFTVSS
jgi:hypothetical protein